jgi:transcriptional regulator with XRE-family HTH domain
MEMNRKKVLQAAGDKLTQLRKLKDYTRPQMASYLGITGSGYNKNENGTTLPALETMFRLAMEDQISMDWFIFSKGPMYYNDKERSAEIEELKKQLALKTESEKAIQADSKKADGPDIKPEIKELIEHMESIPLLYHEILSHYQRFKIDNRALVESSLALNE